jgi:Lar family restriction alleviation protein
MAEGKGHTELLPCPFCGGDSDRICNGLGWPVVECNQCGARGPCIHRSAESGEYIEDWNTRTAVNTYPAVEGLVKALEDCRSTLSMLTEPNEIRSSSVQHAWAQAVECERKARSALSRFRSLQEGGAND